ncbi:hypothetical protein LN457_18070 [Xanthomonas phaseoli]|uniref:hypothetical protein n=1 Tax=Xanthomonas phaseoli TaxID=1985254 RepID=UPI00035CE5AD|nr:hypothetical protein [Xanthomonas phaseoli]MCC8534675.1 hypothetical protein [Xanthomonas phaseoli]
MHAARWETETRWYEAAVFLDLFGTYTVIRSWGGKGSRRHGQLVEVADDEAAAQARLEALDRERKARKPPYSRVA